MWLKSEALASTVWWISRLWYFDLKLILRIRSIVYTQKKSKKQSPISKFWTFSMSSCQWWHLMRFTWRWTSKGLKATPFSDLPVLQQNTRFGLVTVLSVHSWVHSTCGGDGLEVMTWCQDRSPQMIEGLLSNLIAYFRIFDRGELFQFNQIFIGPCFVINGSYTPNNYHKNLTDASIHGGPVLWSGSLS